MTIVINVLAFVLVGLVLVLAILRIREQNKLKDATINLRRSHRRFGRTLDRLETFTNRVGQDNSPSSIDDDDRLVMAVSHKPSAQFAYRTTELWSEYQVRGLNPLADHPCRVGHRKLRKTTLKDYPWFEEDASEYGLVVSH